MMGYFAKKRLGQNFLNSENIINSIIETIDPQSSDTIIEIGPGRGALTLPLVESGAKIIAVEFDRDLIGYLTKMFASFKNIELINADFLEYEAVEGNYKLVGNLPYNLSSPVIEWTTENRRHIDSAYFMLQKEVADRLAATPGNKNWSPLSIFTQLYFDVEICFDISPDNFDPPPKVKSSFVKLVKKDEPKILDITLFEKIIRQSFKQRRKTLANNLIPEIVADSQTLLNILSELKLDSKVRAEQIDTETFLKLTGLII